MSVLTAIAEATKAGDHRRTAELTRQALEQGLAVEKIIGESLIPAMAEVGEEFASGVRYIPEMLIAARAMQSGMAVLKPRIVGGQVKTLARVVIGTVRGDMHDIGKNLVGMMMEGSGLEVVDLGVDVAPQAFVEAVRSHSPQFVALSALLTTTMTSMKETIEALGAAGLRDRVKVLVGGAPVSQKFAEAIGADGYGQDAAAAVHLVKALLS